MTKLSIDRPILVCNFKTYLQAIGPKAVKLATYADEVSKSTGIQIILTPFISDISEIVKTTDLPIFAQHLDYAMPGKNTGHILPEAMKDLGIKGTLINHIEKPLKFSETEQTISRCNQLDLISCLCSSGFNQSEELAKLNPDIMIIELPELIGTGKAISTANPGQLMGIVLSFSRNAPARPWVTVIYLAETFSFNSEASVISFPSRWRISWRSSVALIIKLSML